MLKVITYISLFLLIGCLEDSKNSSGSSKSRELGEVPTEPIETTETTTPRECYFPKKTEILKDGRHLIFKDENDSRFKIYDTYTTQTLNEFKSLNRIVAMSHDGSFWVKKASDRRYVLEKSLNGVQYYRKNFYLNEKHTHEFIFDSSNQFLVIIETAQNGKSQISVYDIENYDFLYSKRVKGLTLAKVSSRGVLAYLTNFSNEQILWTVDTQRLNESSLKLLETTTSKIFIAREYIGVVKQDQIYLHSLVTPELSRYLLVKNTIHYDENSSSLLYINDKDQVKLMDFDSLENKTVELPNTVLYSTCKLNSAENQILCYEDKNLDRLFKFSLENKKLNQICL